MDAPQSLANGTSTLILTLDLILTSGTKALTGGANALISGTKALTSRTKALNLLISKNVLKTPDPVYNIA